MFLNCGGLKHLNASMLAVFVRSVHLDGHSAAGSCINHVTRGVELTGLSTEPLFVVVVVVVGGGRCRRPRPRRFRGVKRRRSKGFNSILRLSARFFSSIWKLDGFGGLSSRLLPARSSGQMAATDR